MSGVTAVRWRQWRYLLGLGLVLEEQLEQGGGEGGVGQQWHRGGGSQDACTQGENVRISRTREKS